MDHAGMEEDRRELEARRNGTWPLPKRKEYTVKAVPFKQVIEEVLLVLKTNLEKK